MMLYFAESGTTPDCVCAAIGAGKCREELGDFICTRPEGHDGLHVVCGLFTHQGIAWDETGRIEIRRPIPGP